MLPRVMLLGALVAGMAAFGAPASSGSPAAKRHFQEGARAYKEGQYEEAIRDFEAAAEADRQASGLDHPRPAILYNLAQCHEKLGNLTAAVQSYKDYLRLAPDAEDRGTVQTAIASLQRRLAERKQSVVINTTPAGADVALDGEARGKSPVVTELSSGSHELVAVLPGYLPLRRSIAVTPDAPLRLDLPLLADPAAKPTAALPLAVAAPEALAKATPQRPRLYTWIAAGVCGAGLVTGAILGGLAQADAKRLTGTMQTNRDAAQTLLDSSRSKASAANVTYVVAGVAGVAGITLFFVEGRF